ncbi:AAA family ATPase [Blastococcus sp. CT_GayMR16]|uniref:ATP-binding protein n=1 Tax=Blastococcus sp. CT_GayMR16 TaxID=2559607 RepID=UPI001072F474|nr:AAA family ATPase [Blastococcus sp. CT_GayMR16]TFV89414.1 hypothetical protein E4P38_06405 [Blastococcus sp. CT_GayMR16]
MARADGTSFVGRTGILDTLAGPLADLATGAGWAAVVYGEAGIGKTRTLEEVARLARDRGVLVAWGHCTELDGVPPYWPWREVFRALDVTPPAEPDGRATVLDSLVTRLDEVARDRPVLLCMEDLHWADADTRWLLRGVMEATAGRAAGVLATWRTAESDDGFAGLPPRIRRVPLAPLVPAQTVELARALAEGDMADEAVQLAARQSGGNPFFVGELVRMHRLGATGGERVPRGVRDVLARRLARLPSATVEVITAAAVLGTDADLAVLAMTVGQPPTAVRGVLEDAVRAGLLGPPDDRGPVRFVHAVVREVLLDEAGPGRRATLHDRAARALERCRPDADEALALHWAHVPGPHADERTVAHARAARDAARAASALEQAVVFAELVSDRVDDPADLLALGDLRARSGNVTGAREDLLRAASRAREAGRDDVLARAALALSGGEGGFEVALNDDAQIRLLDEAVRTLPPGGLRARVRARQAVATSVTTSLPERVAMARAAVREAEGTTDDGALLHALAAYADTIGGPRHVAERRAVADRMLALARRLGDANGELLARRFRLVAVLEVGDFPAADAEIAAFDALAHRTQEPGHLWYPPLWRGMRALLAGREAEAEGYADQVDAVGDRAQSMNARMLATTLRCAVRWGRADELLDLVAGVEEYAADVPPDIPQLLVAMASMYAGLRDAEKTARYYRPLADVGFRTLPEDAEFLSGLLGAVEAATLLGDRTGAAVLFDLLEPYAALWIVDGIGAACWGLAAEWLARLAELLGRSHDAERFRRQASAAYRAAGAAGPLRRLDGDADRPTGRHGQLRREAGGWVVGWGDEQAVLPDLKGLHDLAELLPRPGIPVPAVRLLAAGAGVELGPSTGADEVLDERARSAYRTRLRELEDYIAEARGDTDEERAGRLEDEREFLLRELSAALGLGGRPRRLGDDADRARKAVTMRLRDVIARLEQPLPALARHLRAAVRTGRACSYEPEEPVSWRVRSRPPTS